MRQPEIVLCVAALAVPSSLCDWGFINADPDDLAGQQRHIQKLSVAMNSSTIEDPLNDTYPTVPDELISPSPHPPPSSTKDNASQIKQKLHAHPLACSDKSFITFR